jgi:superoxide reductase
MTKNNEIYKCELCGNIVEIKHEAEGELICCGQPMNNKIENTIDAATEKHVPIIEKDGDLITVKVGETLHPMEDSHFIEFIEILRDGEVIANKQFKPGDEPIAIFCLKDSEGIIAREYCNLHGLWKS